ncbi:transglutaminase family protein [Methanoregula sp.]|uniref:transglutaminase-like domain-containing protein n=1 Tax=Methanoregula sp. TaxID=2052170 RepID=UPI002372D83E|nr:transglutaminase family protein [Methanoregula sp.]MDD1687690.1 transglutaminase family protein [Methanoregula sp.]
MASLVSRFFQEWTGGLDPRQGRIAVFEHIRDIPYSLSVSMTDPKTSPEQILSLGKGYCGPKHYLLAAMYRKLDLDVVYATFPFLWNDPDLPYPPELRRLSAAMPVAYHLACRVRINGRWVLVDATWDRPLAKAGFPVNEHWDGFAEMRCAVTPLRSAVMTAYCRTATNEPCRDSQDAGLHPLDGEQDHGDEEDHMQYYRGKTGMRTSEQIGQIARFYPAFDAWLTKLRE